MQGGIVEERISFTSGPLRLTGVLAYTDSASPQRAVLVCSPHPYFAGNMDNNVVCAIARKSAEHGVTLRFDYRGVEDSQISLPDGLSVFDYWSEIEETKNYADAVRDVSAAAGALAAAVGGLDIPFSIVGYSFGAATGLLYAHANEDICNMVAIAPPLGKVSFDFLSDCSKPGLFLIGTGDFLYSQEKTEQLRQTLSSAATIEVMDNVDHFFRGDEDIVTQKVVGFIRNNVISGSRRISDAI